MPKHVFAACFIFIFFHFFFRVQFQSFFRVLFRCCFVSLCHRWFSLTWRLDFPKWLKSISRAFNFYTRQTHKNRFPCFPFGPANSHDANIVKQCTASWKKNRNVRVSEKKKRRRKKNREKNRIFAEKSSAYTNTQKRFGPIVSLYIFFWWVCLYSLSLWIMK